MLVRQDTSFSKGRAGHFSSLSLVLLLSLAAMAVSGAVPAVHATSVISITTSDGSTVCLGSLGGTWDAASDTCSIAGTLIIPPGTTLSIGAGVTVLVVANSGVNGCDSCGWSSDGGDGSSGGAGINNSGTISNEGTIGGAGDYIGGAGGYGGDSFIDGHGGHGGNGIYNVGTINNEGTIDGSAGNDGFGISNGVTINDYCGGTTTYSTYVGTQPVSIYCYPVTFDQVGVPTWIGGQAVNWGVSVTWLFGTTNYTSTGATISVPSLAGSITYSYSTPVTGSGTAYDCNWGCSGTATVSGAMTFTATYNHAFPPAPSTGAEVCQNQASGECFTSFIAFDVTIGGSVVNANVTLVSAHGPTQIGTTEVAGRMAWYDVSILDTITYTVALPNGHTVTGTVSNPTPWTLRVVDVSG